MIEQTGRVRSSRVTQHWEWPTLWLIAGFHLTFAGLAWQHEAFPAPLAVVLFAILGCFHLSLLHEVLHGHPTPHQRLNEALVHVPAVVWLPYADYRDSHRLHHRVPLTVPGIDPESFYVDAAAWRRANPIWRAVLLANRTLLGRMVIWPGVVIVRTLAHEIRVAPTVPARRRTWLIHLPSAAVTLWLVLGVAGVPWWMFLGGFVYGGVALTYVRSFVEHLPVPSGSESAVVRAHPFWALLFLNNNLHHAHHALPDAAWYRLPAVARDLGSAEAAAAGAGLYGGYAEVFRRHFLRPFDAPVHPAERVVVTDALPAAGA